MPNNVLTQQTAITQLNPSQCPFRGLTNKLGSFLARTPGFCSVSCQPSLEESKSSSVTQLDMGLYLWWQGSDLDWLCRSAPLCKVEMKSFN